MYDYQEPSQISVPTKEKIIRFVMLKVITINILNKKVQFFLT